MMEYLLASLSCRVGIEISKFVKISLGLLLNYWFLYKGKESEVHAWLVCDGEKVTGGNGASDFTATFALFNFF
ncbi:hypothetical protein [Aquirufa nivalisilvae]